MKAYLKERGYRWKIKVRTRSNPFGGRDRFEIRLHEDEILDGVVMASRGDSRSGMVWFSSDQGHTARKLNELKDHFNGATMMPFKGDEPRPGEP